MVSCNLPYPFPSFSGSHCFAFATLVSKERHSTLLCYLFVRVHSMAKQHVVLETVRIPLERGSVVRQDVLPVPSQGSVTEVMAADNLEHDDEVAHFP